MGHRVLAGLAFATLLATGLAVRARAEDGEKGPAASPAVPWELRVYPVRAWVRGHPLYTTDRGPYPSPSDQVNDETNPLFGSEGDEPVHDVGTAADVIERMKAQIGPSGAFEQEGVLLQHVGGSFVWIRGPAALHERVAAWLAQTGRRSQRTALLDVAVFEGAPSAADAPGGVTGAVASGAWVPLGVVRIALAPQGGGAARAGGVRAYLQDWGVEVAEESATGDPIVGVAPDGLAVDAVAAAVSKDQARVRLRGWWASPATWEQRTTKDGDLIETPSVRGATLEADVVLGGGAWTVLPASGRTVFAARLRVTDMDGAAEPSAGWGGAPSRATGPAGPLTLRSFDVRDLTLDVRHRRGIEAGLFPSNFTPREPPAVPEPAPLVSSDVLADLAKHFASPETWTREGTSIEVRDGEIVARNDEATLADVGALFDELRARVLKTTTVRASIVSLPLSSIPEWWSGLPEDLTREGGAALLERPGARVVDTASLRLREGQRLAALGGERRTYVSDYDVEIAKNSAIGNPIVRSLFSGLSLDVEADRLFGAPAVRVGLRVDHSHVLAMRGVPTRHGEIECPTLGLSRLRGEATVALGSTRVLGAWGVGGEIRLLLVTASD